MRARKIIASSIILLHYIIAQPLLGFEITTEVEVRDMSELSYSEMRIETPLGTFANGILYREGVNAEREKAKAARLSHNAIQANLDSLEAKLVATFAHIYQNALRYKDTPHIVDQTQKTLLKVTDTLSQKALTRDEALMLRNYAGTLITKVAQLTTEIVALKNHQLVVALQQSINRATAIVALSPLRIEQAKATLQEEVALLHQKGLNGIEVDGALKNALMKMDSLYLESLVASNPDQALQRLYSGQYNDYGADFALFFKNKALSNKARTPS